MWKSVLLRYVGINSQLDQIIEGGSIDIKRLWFGDYLEQQSTPSEDTAQVDVIFRICQCLSTRWLLECSFFSLEPLEHCYRHTATRDKQQSRSR